MTFEIGWTPTARHALIKSPEKVSTAVIEFCYGPLADNPYRVGKALRLQIEGLHSARRGDFRVIYRISHTEMEVVVIAVGHRSDVYRQH
jgi:mRNA interferase RelE/StbE